MTDNNVAEIKSLSYVCKDRNVNHPNIYQKERKGEISMHKIPTYDMTCNQTNKQTHKRQTGLNPPVESPSCQRQTKYLSFYPSSYLFY
jgi:hypothetical protein